MLMVVRKDKVNVHKSIDIICPREPEEEDCTIRRPIVTNYKITKEITMRALCVRSPHRRPEV